MVQTEAQANSTIRLISATLKIMPLSDLELF